MFSLLRFDRFCQRAKGFSSGAFASFGAGGVWAVVSDARGLRFKAMRFWGDGRVAGREEKARADFGLF